MILTNVKVDQLALINWFNTNDHNAEDMYRLMTLGLVPGVEIRKIGEVATCAEYRVENVAASLVISKELTDYIHVDTLDETLD